MQKTRILGMGSLVLAAAAGFGPVSRAGSRVGAGAARIDPPAGAGGANAVGGTARALADRRKLNARSLKQLMKLLRDHYSYYELRGIDWRALEKKHRKKIRAATSTRAWVRRVARMLAKAEDLHLSLEYRGRRTATFVRKIEPNFDLEGIRKTLPSFRQRNRCVFTAKTDDNIGYILIGTLLHERAPQLEAVQGILREFRSCRALILDLRPNGGGDERLARPIAAWFVDGKRVYAKNLNRDPAAKGGFRRAYSRTITGNPAERRFDKPVAVLMGPWNMSSCEAFLLMLRQGPRVTLIGERSYGSSGNPKPFALPNGVTVHIPSWKALRPDGACFEGVGIAPDIRVRAEAAAFRRGDPIIERALAWLREKTE